MDKIKLGLGIIFIFFLGIESTGSVLAVGSKVVRVGAFSNYPMIFQDIDGTLKGFYVDLLTEIGEKEDIQFQYVYGDWSQGLERIKNGEVDMLTSAALTEERLGFMSFPKTPLLTVWGEVYVTGSSDIDGILKMADKKIGILKGDINAENFKKLVSGFGLSCQYVEFLSYDELFNGIKEGVVEAGVAGITFGMANENKYGLKSSGVVFNPVDLFFTVSKDKEGYLLPILDKYITEWKAKNDSYYYVAKQKWLGGGVKVETVMPLWAKYALIVGPTMFFIAILFIVLLKIQIDKATSKLKQETDELKESDRRYKFLVDKMQEIALIVDDKGIIKYVNKFTCVVLGYSEEEILGKNVGDFILPEFLEKVMVEIGKTFEGKDGEDFEVQVHSKSGIPKIIKVSGESNPIIRDGKIVEILVNALDITKQKTYEKELIESKSVLQTKVEELEKTNDLTVGRELKMLELKNEIEKLKNKEETKNK